MTTTTQHLNGPAAETRPEQPSPELSNDNNAETPHDRHSMDEWLEALRQAVAAPEQKRRKILQVLLEAKRPAEECYDRLRAAGLNKPRASDFKALVGCPAVAAQFLEGPLSWRNALRQARQAQPTAWRPKPVDRKKQAIRRFIKLLTELGLTEFKHSGGTFRLKLTPATNTTQN